MAPQGPGTQPLAPPDVPSVLRKEIPPVQLQNRHEAGRATPRASGGGERSDGAPGVRRPGSKSVGRAVWSRLREAFSVEAMGIPRVPAEAKLFLRLAWFANPFAYVAINTLIAVMPGVADRLGLSTTLAGFCCSVWCFARVAAFIWLWFWAGWHYRFGWLLAAYGILIGAFTLILTVPNLAVVVLAQLVFGGAIGLIYYSSLFYSMDVGETKGEHGGIHEAAIGLGNCAGPAVGAVSLYCLPHYAHSGALAVSLLLVGGLAGLLAIRRTRRAC